MENYDYDDSSQQLGVVHSINILRVCSVGATLTPNIADDDDEGKTCFLCFSPSPPDLHIPPSPGYRHTMRETGRGEKTDSDKKRRRRRNNNGKLMPAHPPTTETQ